MAENDILQYMISAPGQNQEGRMPEELKIHFADVDQRTTEDLLHFTRKLAGIVNYYPKEGPGPAGDWTLFFPADKAEIKKLLSDTSGKTPPHLALFLSFLELYEKPRDVINRITGEHLKFYYEDVLRFKARAAQPDRAHLLIELKKNEKTIEISPDHEFSAGKDATGVELIYTPVRTSLITTASVADVRSVFVGDAGRGTVRYAPFAKSSDGLGGKLEGDEPSWPGFGHEGLPPAEVGFAIASPVLRMKEGLRNVTVDLTLNPAGSMELNTSALTSVFDLYISGEKDWIRPEAASVNIVGGNILRIKFTIPDTEPGVIDYNSAIHGYAYAAHAPVIQVLLKEGTADIGYQDLKRIIIERAAVSVEVSGVTSLLVESDAGVLDPKRAFLPFGTQPAAGSRFMVGCSEALSKKLSELKIAVLWQAAPVNFAHYYHTYGARAVENGYFTAAAEFKAGGSWEYKNSGIHLFEGRDATAPHTFTFAPGAFSASKPVSDGTKVHALSAAGSEWAKLAARKYVHARPVLSPSAKTSIEPRPGFITFTLEKDFLHSNYRNKFIANVLQYSSTGNLTILNEPYTPTIQTISLGYSAYSDAVKISSADAGIDDFTNTDVGFFHISYFGQMREHGYQRNQFPFLADKAVYLLPQYDNEGELLIGLKDLKPGESANVLFQVAEGSEDPVLNREKVSWFVLCDNYWKQLGTAEVTNDTTNQLLRSGIITFMIPSDATISNTILPANRVWLKAAVKANVNAVCRMIDIEANAVEVSFVDRQNDPNHLVAGITGGKLAKLKNGLAPVKTVKQPYASFGGRPKETEDSLYTRVSERLRHKDRCITAWDYERIVLQAFPNVHKVKCIPHAKEGCWLAPGNVMIVVVPDLKNKNAVDRLQPRANADTLSSIQAHVQKRTGSQVRVTVQNPRYQKILIEFKVKFTPGHEYNYYSTELNKAIVRYLSPWAFKSDKDVSFGGTIYKSRLIEVVEKLDYVDYLTDFKMYTYMSAMPKLNDVDEVKPEAPDTVLVSEKQHNISEIET